MPKNALSGEAKVPRLKSFIRPRVLGVQLVNVVVPTGSIPADMPIKSYVCGFLRIVIICYNLDEAFRLHALFKEVC